MEVRAVTSEAFDTFYNATGVGFGRHSTAWEVEATRHIAELDRTPATSTPRLSTPTMNADALPLYHAFHLLIRRRRQVVVLRIFR